LTPDKIGARDISGIDEMVPWEELLFGQPGVDHGENPLITDGSLGRLDMGDQLRSLFIAGLGEMHLIADPQGSSFLAIACVEIIGRVDELGRRESWLLPPLSSLVERFKLLLPDRAQRLDGR
jgi:hypothetical protein